MSEQLFFRDDRRSGNRHVLEDTLVHATSIGEHRMFLNPHNNNTASILFLCLVRSVWVFNRSSLRLRVYRADWD
jgi:hypothetical protein